MPIICCEPIKIELCELKNPWCRFTSILTWESANLSHRPEKLGRDTQHQNQQSVLAGDWADERPKLHEHSTKSDYESTTLRYNKYVQPSGSVELSLHSSWLRGRFLACT